MKKLIVENIIIPPGPITEDERIRIENAVEDIEIPFVDKLLIDQLYKMAKTYANSEFSAEDLFKKALKIYVIQASNKVIFKNSEKWDEQILWRGRMNILAAMEADEK